MNQGRWVRQVECMGNVQFETLKGRVQFRDFAVVSHV
jgi:hypothetical protein